MSTGVFQVYVYKQKENGTPPWTTNSAEQQFVPKRLRHCGVFETDPAPQKRDPQIIIIYFGGGLIGSHKSKPFFRGWLSQTFPSLTKSFAVVLSTIP